MQQNKLQKHLKRAISKNGTRPILECAHYSSDGSLSVTDSHRMLMIEEFHEHKATFNQNLLTMELDENVYPDVKKLIPDLEKAATKLTISLGALKRALISLKTVSRETVKIQMFDDYVILSNQSDRQYDIEFEIKLNVAIVGEKMTVSFNAQYLLEAVEFLLDAKQRYAVDNVDLYLTSPMKPIIMKIEDQKYTYLVTPVRTYE